MIQVEHASLYLTKYPADLHRFLPNAKSNASFLKKASRIDFVVDDQPGYFSVMQKSLMDEHLAGFLGYMHHLCRIGTNDENEIRLAASILPNVKCVLGCWFARPFSVNSKTMQMLFVVAYKYDGYVFLLDSLLDPKRRTLCGPAKFTARD